MDNKSIICPIPISGHTGWCLKCIPTYQTLWKRKEGNEGRGSGWKLESRVNISE